MEAEATIKHDVDNCDTTTITLTCITMRRCNASSVEEMKNVILDTGSLYVRTIWAVNTANTVRTTGSSYDEISHCVTSLGFGNTARAEILEDGGSETTQYLRRVEERRDEARREEKRRRKKGIE